MCNLIDRHEEEHKSLRKRAKVAEAAVKRDKEDRIAEVGSIREGHELRPG